MFHSQESYLPRIWDAWTESLWLFEAEQIPTSSSEIHSSDSLSSLDCASETKTTGTDSCGSEARKHYVGRSPETTLSSQSHWLWVCFSCLQSSVLDVPSVSLLQGSWDYSWSSLLWSHRHVVFGMCNCRTVSGMASLSWFFWVWPDSIHQSNSRSPRRTHVKPGNEDFSLLL